MRHDVQGDVRRVDVRRDVRRGLDMRHDVYGDVWWGLDVRGFDVRGGRNVRRADVSRPDLLGPHVRRPDLCGVPYLCRDPDVRYNV